MKNIDPRQYTSDILNDWVNIYFWPNWSSISMLLSSLSYSSYSFGGIVPLSNM